MNLVYKGINPAGRPVQLEDDAPQATGLGLNWLNDQWRRHDEVGFGVTFNPLLVMSNFGLEATLP